MISILIPTTVDRQKYLDNLLFKLSEQIGHPPAPHWLSENVEQMLFDDFEILIDHTEKDKIGTKRNRLLAAASGNYLAFFDSDDSPTEVYISTLREGGLSGKDCISLRGIMTVDGKNPEAFEHSIKYDKWETLPDKIYPEVKYLRNPNHLNCIKSEIAKQISFPEINHAEDFAWSKKLFESNLIKTEYYHENFLYYYRYRSKK